jgi:hypothetical protein
MTKRASLAARIKSAAAEQQDAPIVSVPTETLEASPKAAKPAKTTRAKSREGKKFMLIPVDPQEHLEMRHCALDLEMTVEAFIRAAMREKVANHSKAAKPAKAASRGD